MKRPRAAHKPAEKPGLPLPPLPNIDRAYREALISAWHKAWRERRLANPESI